MRVSVSGRCVCVHLSRVRWSFARARLMSPLQIHLNISMAAAAAYLSLLIGRQIPPSMAFYGYVGILGTAASFPMNKLCLDAARENGFTTIVVSAGQVGTRGM